MRSRLQPHHPEKIMRLRSIDVDFGILRQRLIDEQADAAVRRPGGCCGHRCRLAQPRVRAYPVSRLRRGPDMRSLILPILLAAAVPLHAAPLPPAIAAAIADQDRSPKAREADPIRKPAETLVFSGVRPGMTVGEFYPGGGYFTRLLNDVVGPKGHVYAIENKRWEGPQGAAAFGRLTNVTYSSGPFGMVEFPKPLDLAWVTQNYHDLKIAEYGVVDTAAFNRAVFAALKPGGVFMIVDHEAPKGTDVPGITKLHR